MRWMKSGAPMSLPQSLWWERCSVLQGHASKFKRRRLNISDAKECGQGMCTVTDTSVCNEPRGVTIWATRRMKQTRSVDGIIWFNIKEWFQLHDIRDYIILMISQNIRLIHSIVLCHIPVPTDGFITTTGHGRRPAGSNPLEYTKNTRSCIMTSTGDDRLLYNQDRPLPTTLYTFYPVG